MPLVISMRVGETFYASDAGAAPTSAKLTRIDSPSQFVLMTADGREHDISDVRGTEVLPDVVVSAGREGHTGVARLAIQAPRRIKITRGSCDESRS